MLALARMGETTAPCGAPVVVWHDPVGLAIQPRVPVCPRVRCSRNRNRWSRESRSRPNVRIDYPVDLAPFDGARASSASSRPAAPTAGPIAEPEKFRLVKRRQDDIHYRHPDNLVFQGAMPSGRVPPSGLGISTRPRRQRPIRPVYAPCRRRAAALPVHGPRTPSTPDRASRCGLLQVVEDAHRSATVAGPKSAAARVSPAAPSASRIRSPPATRCVRSCPVREFRPWLRPFPPATPQGRSLVRRRYSGLIRLLHSVHHRIRNPPSLCGRFD